MSKYEPLRKYLEKSDEKRVSLSFERIEKILNAELPSSAFKHRPWWANGGHSQADAWLDAGYKVDSVDQHKREVVFRKAGKPGKKEQKSKTSSPRKKTKPKKQPEGGVALVSCTKSKRPTPSKPKDLYMESALFRKARRYCELYHDDWYIISAKHHLIEPDGQEIEPYDETLKNFSADEKRRWSLHVFMQLKQNNLLDKKIYIHAGEDYYKYLLPHLDEAGVDYEIPTKGLQLGETMSWYNRWI